MFEEDKGSLLKSKYKLLGDLGCLDLQIQKMKKDNWGKDHQHMSQFYRKYMSQMRKEEQGPATGYAQMHSQKRANSPCETQSQVSLDSDSKELFANQRIKKSQIRNPRGPEKQTIA